MVHKLKKHKYFVRAPFSQLRARTGDGESGPLAERSRGASFFHSWRKMEETFLRDFFSIAKKQKTCNNVLVVAMVSVD